MIYITVRQQNGVLPLGRHISADVLRFQRLKVVKADKSPVQANQLNTAQILGELQSRRRLKKKGKKVSFKSSNIFSYGPK